jgi:hypothetical protein
VIWQLKFPHPGSFYIFNFFLFERAHQDAEHDRVLFLSLTFKGKNDIRSSMTRKISKNGNLLIEVAVYIIKIKHN